MATSVFPGGVVPTVQPGLQPQYTAAGYNFNGFCAYGSRRVHERLSGALQGIWADRLPSVRRHLQLQLATSFAAAPLQQGPDLRAVYTFSKALATANSDQDTQDPFKPLLDYRATSWDRTHVFAANYVYDLPGVTKHFGGPKWLSYVTDNYQLSGITQLMTGTPVDLNSGFSFPPGKRDRLKPIRSDPVLLHSRPEWEPCSPRHRAPGAGNS